MRFFLLLLLSTFALCQDGLGPAPTASAAPSGAAGGDLAGTYPNPTVAAARFSAPGAIGSVTPSTIVGTTVTSTGQLVSTVAGGTAPIVVTSTSQVLNLNGTYMQGGDWSNPPTTIGAVTPNGGRFTVLSTTETTSSTTSNIDSLATTGFVRLTGAAPVLRGITAPAAATASVVVFHCVNATTVTNESGSVATAADRINTGTAGNLSISAGKRFTVMYSPTDARWFVINQSP